MFLSSFSSVFLDDLTKKAPLPDITMDFYILILYNIMLLFFKIYILIIVELSLYYKISANLEKYKATTIANQ